MSKMVARMAQAQELTVRQKLAMFHGTTVTAEQALKMQENEINAEMWRAHGATRACAPARACARLRAPTRAYARLRALAQE